jgi:hypothetical protein
MAATSVTHRRQPASLKSSSGDDLSSLRQVIEGLTTKVDQLQSSTGNLKRALDSKDRELARLKSVNQLRQPVVVSHPSRFTTSTASVQPVGASANVRSTGYGYGYASKGKERGVQTLVNMGELEGNKEYETFSYLYDKDQELLRGEKDALLKYMRKEVV